MRRETFRLAIGDDLMWMDKWETLFDIAEKFIKKG
jgi:hypothetical protein